MIPMLPMLPMIPMMAVIPMIPMLPMIPMMAVIPMIPVIPIHPSVHTCCGRAIPFLVRLLARGPVCVRHPKPDFYGT